jgi:benzaldehyde dehydrogenase (NAD)
MSDTLQVANRLIDEAGFDSRIFIDGEWVTGAGGAIPSMEPATGETLAMVGIAGPADVTRAAEGAARAQKEWAALPHPARAAVLRRAGQLWEEHAEEISGWNIREVGAIPPLAGFALHVTAAECYEASALPSAPRGSLLSSEEPRLSFSQQVPVGVVGVISPFNVPLILGIRAVAPALALGNAVLLKPDPRTVITGGVAMVRIFEEAGLPAGLLQLVPGGAEVGEAMIADPRVRVIAFTARRPSSHARPPRARWQLGVHREVGRGCRAGRESRHMGGVPPSGSDLHDGRPPHRPRVAVR